MQWRAFNFTSKSKKDEHLSLLKTIEQGLLQSGLWQVQCLGEIPFHVLHSSVCSGLAYISLLFCLIVQRPRICFGESVPPATVNELSRICQKHKATIVSSSKKATHLEHRLRTVGLYHRARYPFGMHQRTLVPLDQKFKTTELAVYVFVDRATAPLYFKAAIAVFAHTQNFVHQRFWCRCFMDFGLIRSHP